LPDKSRRNFDTLQCGRGLAALAVVCFHANLTLGLPKYFGEEPSHFFSSGFSGIYYFFVLSGTVMLLAHWDQIGLVHNPAGFYLKRFKRIYLPLWGALLFIVPALANRISPFDIFLAFSALPTVHENVLAVEWTLRHEVLFYVVFGIFLWRPIAGGVILAAWIASSLLGAFFPILFPWSFLLSPLHFLFAAGMAGAVAIRRRIGPPVTTSFVGVSLFASTWVIQAGGVSLPGTAWPILYGVGAAFLIVGLARLETVRALPIPRFLRALGDASYSLYLVHFPIVSLCAKLAKYLVLRPQYALLLIIFSAVVLVSIASGFIFHLLVERPMLRLRYSMASTIVK